MKILSVIGISSSGKTTTVECIIRELVRRRYSVGSVKDIHFEEFAIDTPGSNTERHKEAGANLVTARGLKETDILFPFKLSIDRILDFYSQDWVVLEGVREVNAPKIVCAHSIEEIDRLLGPDTIAISGVVSNTGIVDYKGIPVFNPLNQQVELADYLEQKVFTRLPDFTAKCCGLCGLSCRDLLAAIVRGDKGREDCILQQQVELKVGGKDITMVPFVQEILARTIISLASTLDGYESHKELKIVVSPRNRLGQ